MAVLELRNISKSFGAIQAVVDLHLSLEAGSVLGLMGDNGAGKSTVVKMISGNFAPSAGQISVDGVAHQFRGPLDARTAGIEAVYQDLALCDNLSAAANVFLGRELCKSFALFSVLDFEGMNTKADALFAELQSEARADRLVKFLSGGQRQAVAIARTLLAKAKIVIMDEPTAAISVRQVSEVLQLIQRLRDRGVAVILISHRMPDIFTVCDRVVVMRRGRKVSDKQIAATSPEEVTALITGALHEA